MNSPCNKRKNLIGICIPRVCTGCIYLLKSCIRRIHCTVSSIARSRFCSIEILILHICICLIRILCMCMSYCRSRIGSICQISNDCCCMTIYMSLRICSRRHCIPDPDRRCQRWFCIFLLIGRNRNHSGRQKPKYRKCCNSEIPILRI